MMKKLIILSLLLLIVNEALAVKVKVQLHHENKEFLNNNNVCFFKCKSFIFKTSPSYCATSDQFGVIELDIPEGDYYVFSEKELKDRYIFGFYGLNPLKATKSKILNINLIDYPQKFVKKIKEKGVFWTT